MQIIRMKYKFSPQSQMNVIKLGEPEATRWYILIIYSIISALQCNAWFTFSSVPNEVEQYYHLDNPGGDKVNHTIDLWINYGPIMFLCTTPFAAYLLLYPIKGLRSTILLSANFILFGSFIRCIPSILHDVSSINYQITNSFWNTLIFIHIGQILVNLAGPLVLASPSKLSVIWFPEYQRKTATAIAAISNAFGQCLSFIMTPLIVQHRSENFKYVLYVDLALISVMYLLVLVHFPVSPHRLPTIAAKAALLSVPVGELYKFGNEMVSASTQSQSLSVWDATESIGSTGKTGTDEQLLGRSLFCDSDVSHIVTNIRHSYKRFTLKKHLHNLVLEMKWMIMSLSSVLMMLIGGMEIGSFAAWSAVLPDVIGSESALRLSDQNVGIIGFIGTCAYMCGGIIIGPICDRWFAKRLKKLLFWICIALMVCVFCLSLVVPSPFHNAYGLSEQHSVEQRMLMIGILNGVCGLFVGCSLPVFYELCAEISYPVSEGSSAISLVFMENIALLVLVAMANWISTQWFPVLLLFVCVLCVVLLLFVKETYKRM
eukprot:191317_1